MSITAAVWKEARSQVESLDERIRALLEANAPALLGIEAVSYTHLDVYKRQAHPHAILWGELSRHKEAIGLRGGLGLGDRTHKISSKSNDRLLRARCV